MSVSDGDLVTIEYIGRLEDGTVFDTSDEGLAHEVGLADQDPDRVFQPLTVEVGEDTVIPGLQDALLGLAEGEEATVEIPPERGYGTYDPDRIGEYDRDGFEAMLGDRDLVEGFEVETTEDGLPGRVVDFDDETVTVDFNHELADETLTFEIEVVDVE